MKTIQFSSTLCLQRRAAAAAAAAAPTAAPAPAEQRRRRRTVQPGAAGCCRCAVQSAASLRCSVPLERRPGATQSHLMSFPLALPPIHPSIHPSILTPRRRVAAPCHPTRLTPPHHLHSSPLLLSALHAAAARWISQQPPQPKPTRRCPPPVPPPVHLDTYAPHPLSSTEPRQLQRWRTPCGHPPPGSLILCAAGIVVSMRGRCCLAPSLVECPPTPSFHCQSCMHAHVHPRPKNEPWPPAGAPPSAPPCLISFLTLPTGLPWQASSPQFSRIGVSLSRRASKMGRCRGDQGGPHV